jgi:hypothetical protein
VARLTRSRFIIQRSLQIVHDNVRSTAELSANGSATPKIRIKTIDDAELSPDN